MQNSLLARLASRGIHVPGPSVASTLPETRPPDHGHRRASFVETVKPIATDLASESSEMPGEAASLRPMVLQSPRRTLKGEAGDFWRGAAVQWTKAVARCRLDTTPSPARAGSRLTLRASGGANLGGSVRAIESTEDAAQQVATLNATSVAALDSGSKTSDSGEPVEDSTEAKENSGVETTGMGAVAAVGEPEPEPRGDIVVAALQVPGTPADKRPLRRKNKKKRTTEESLTNPKRSLRCRLAISSPGVAAAEMPSLSSSSLQFNSATELCLLCCDDAVPPACAARLADCAHGWYCLHCIQRYAEARLDVGGAHVPCPECGTGVPEHDLKKLLSQGVMDRLLERSLEQAVSSQADLRACPTPSCPMRVALEDDESGHLKCPLCKKVSCVRCGVQPFHKGLTCDKYAEKKRKRVRTSRPDDEALLKRWMEETGTKQCPTCQMAVSKQNIETQLTQESECHKMMCRNCSTKFCFKCLAVLTESFTCGCSIDLHGFCNPFTGKRNTHFRAGRKGDKKKIKK